MDHTSALIQKSHAGDERAKAQLVEENVGLVWCIVKRFYNRGAEAEDLFQIGSIGLLKAIDKFDLSYNVKFSSTSCAFALSSPACDFWIKALVWSIIPVLYRSSFSFLQLSLLPDLK